MMIYGYVCGHQTIHIYRTEKPRPRVIRTRALQISRVKRWTKPTSSNIPSALNQYQKRRNSKSLTRLPQHGRTSRIRVRTGIVFPRIQYILLSLEAGQNPLLSSTSPSSAPAAKSTTKLNWYHIRPIPSPSKIARLSRSSHKLRT